MKNLFFSSLFILIGLSQIKAQNITMEPWDPQPFLQGSDTGDMEFADLDGDGDQDLIITGSGNLSDGTTHGARTTLYINDGTGNFTAISDHTIENIRVSKIGLENIDGDDDLDLLISGFTNGGSQLTKLYTNDGTGTFTEVTNSPFQNLTSGYFNFGDLDNDGDADILFSGGHSGINDVVKYINDGAGNFNLDSNIGIIDIQGVIDLSDIDGDNDLDAIISGEDASQNITTRLYTNDGTGNFLLVSNAGFNNISFGDIATGDTDQDGDVDIVIIGNKSDGQIVTELYINNGSNNFELLSSAPFLGLSVDGETSLNDFDNDGDLDLFVIGSANGGLPNIYSHIYENIGNNNFVLSSEFIGGYLSSHAVADVDGDNLLDIVIGGTTTGNPSRGSFMFKNVADALGVDSQQVDMSVNLYPNPSSGNVFISLESPLQSVVKIYNLTGQLVFEEILSNTQTNTLQLNIPSGMYLAVIENDYKKITKKLLIQN